MIPFVSRMISVHFFPSFVSLRFVLILFYLIRLVLLKCKHLCSAVRVAYPAHLILIHSHPNEIRQGAEILILLVMQFAPSPSYVLPLTSRYPTHYPLLQHSQPILFPSCDRPCFIERCLSRNNNLPGRNKMTKVTNRTKDPCTVFNDVDYVGKKQHYVSDK
jgi:hypothetical protein